jgi:prefoldin alpha subunit
MDKKADTHAKNTPTHPAAENEKQLMFEAELLNQQLSQIQTFLRKLEEQEQEVVAMRDAISQIGAVEQGAELLVPLAPGIFFKATHTGDTQLLVNVGTSTLVPKTPMEVGEMLDMQAKEIDAHGKELAKEYETKLARMQALEAEFAKH